MLLDNQTEDWLLGAASQISACRNFESELGLQGWFYAKEKIRYVHRNVALSACGKVAVWNSNHAKHDGYSSEAAAIETLWRSVVCTACALFGQVPLGGRRKKGEMASTLHDQLDSSRATSHWPGQILMTLCPAQFASGSHWNTGTACVSVRAAHAVCSGTTCSQ